MMSKRWRSMIGAWVALGFASSVASVAIASETIGGLDGATPMLMDAWTVSDSPGWPTAEFGPVISKDARPVTESNLIPTPGSIVLGGLAGVAMLRRRR